MRQYERSGVLVDQCADCRGIFLDRGELERLVDAENAWHEGRRPAAPAYQQQAPYQQQASYQQSQRPYRDYDSDEYPVYGGHHGHKRKKRGSFLEDLFD
jgi:Zn-finger nucleic acid-binding protein